MNMTERITLKTFTRTVLITILVALQVTSTLAATNVELQLEEAIYLEETAGDLAAATKIYLEMLENGEGQRSLLARAHDRLAGCYLKMGRPEDAERHFQKVIEQYPEEAELVARAQLALSASPALEPAPWVDGEVLTYVIKLPTGVQFGVYVFAIESGADASGDLWQIMARRYHDGAASDQGFSRVTVRQGTMRPVHSVFRHSMMGSFESHYEDSTFRMLSHQADGTSKESMIRHAQPVFDNDEWIYLTRSLPLALGYRTTLPLNVFAGEPLKVSFEVTKEKTVKVPAGTFECLKAKSSLGQTFYYSTGPERLVVKMDLPGATAELARVSHRRHSEEEIYRDDQAGFSLTLPAGWFVQGNSEFTKGKKGLLHLLDPGAEQRSFFLWADTPSNKEPELAKIARKTIAADSQALVGQKVRDDSWREDTVDGRPVLFVTTDFRDGEVRLSRYLVWIAGEHKIGRFIFNVPTDRLEALRPVLDEMVASLRLN